MARDAGPDRRTTPSPPRPGGVAIATIVSSRFNDGVRDARCRDRRRDGRGRRHRLGRHRPPLVEAETDRAEARAGAAFRAGTRSAAPWGPVPRSRPGFSAHYATRECSTGALGWSSDLTWT